MSNIDRNINIYLDNFRVLTKTIYGHKMFLDSRDISLTPHLLLDGFWEKWITDFILKDLKEDDHIIEIGANCGYYTLLMSDKIKEKGSLIAFEANPKMCEIVFSNLSINGFLNSSKILNLLIFSEKKEITFKLLSKFMGSSSCFLTNEFVKTYNDTITEINHTSVTLDDYLSTNQKQKVTLIKIDAEGSEPHILAGAKSILKKNNIRLIVEHCPIMISNFYSLDKYYQELINYGFEIKKINHDSTLSLINKDEFINMDYAELYLHKKN